MEVDATSDDLFDRQELFVRCFRDIHIQGSLV